MGRKKKTYSKKYPMLDNIEFELYKLSEEENNERIKELARMLHRFMEEDCKRKKNFNDFQKG